VACSSGVVRYLLVPYSCLLLLLLLLRLGRAIVMPSSCAFAIRVTCTESEQRKARRARLLLNATFLRDFAPRPPSQSQTSRERCRRREWSAVLPCGRSQPAIAMAFILYGAVSNLGSGKVLCRALTDKVMLPKDTPHDVKKEAVMDGMANSILEKAPTTPNTKLSTALAESSLNAHLWNTDDTCFLLIVTPAVDNALVQQLWLMMQAEYIKCRRSGKSVVVFEASLKRHLQACNEELDDAIAESQKQVPRPEDADIVVRAVEGVWKIATGKAKCTRKMASKIFGASVTVFFTGMAVVFAIISCPLK